MPDLLATLHEPFCSSSSKIRREPSTKVVAFDSDGETEIIKSRDNLWRVTINGERYCNSRLGDLIDQVERLGFTVERRAL